MTEREIQFRLYRWRAKQHHRYIVPNSEAFGGFDTDLCSVTNRGYAIDHEIKVSRADFRAEIRAATFVFDSTLGVPFRKAFGSTNHTKYRKHEALKRAAKEADIQTRLGFGQRTTMANYFYFVCPAGLIKHGEVPAHCGLIWYLSESAKRTHCFTVIKEAPLLHKHVVTEDTKAKLSRSLEFRFWNTQAPAYGVQRV